MAGQQRARAAAERALLEERRESGSSSTRQSGRAPETPPEMPMLRLWTSHSGRPPPQQEVSAQAPQRPRPCRWPGGSFALQRHHLAKATTGEQEPERQSAKEPVHSPGPIRRRRTPRPGGCQKPRGRRSHAQRALLYLCVCDHVQVRHGMLLTTHCTERTRVWSVSGPLATPCPHLLMRRER